MESGYKEQNDSDAHDDDDGGGGDDDRVGAGDAVILTAITMTLASSTRCDEKKDTGPCCLSSGAEMRRPFHSKNLHPLHHPIQHS